MDKIIARSSHRYRVLFIVLTTLALLSVIIFSSYRASAESATPAANEHIITLHDNGTDKGFITKKSTLREALAEQHIRVDAKDLIEPGLDAKLVAGSYQVNIYRARPIAIHDGKVDTKVITAYRTPKQIAKEAHVTLHDEDITQLAPSSDPLSDGAAEVMTITRATQFTFNFYGKAETAYTQAKTVGDMLKEKHITMGPKDGLSVTASTPMSAGMSIRIWRDGVQTITQDEDVKFDTKTIKDADRPVNYHEVQTAGENGKKTVTYEVNLQNGIEVARKEINSITTKQATQEVVVVGTKVELPPGSHEDWMAAAGISADDYGYVNYIVNREGGWQPCKVQGGSIDCTYAANGGRMGYGIVQATPGAKMATAGDDWATNPITQLKWATGYAVGRYGSWSGAYNHWLVSHNW